MSAIVFISGLCYLLGDVHTAVVGATISAGVVFVLEAIAAGRE